MWGNVWIILNLYIMEAYQPVVRLFIISLKCIKCLVELSTLTLESQMLIWYLLNRGIWKEIKTCGISECLSPKYFLRLMGRRPWDSPWPLNCIAGSNPEPPTWELPLPADAILSAPEEDKG